MRHGKFWHKPLYEKERAMRQIEKRMSEITKLAWENDVFPIGIFQVPARLEKAATQANCQAKADQALRAKERVEQLLLQIVKLEGKANCRVPRH